MTRLTQNFCAKWLLFNSISIHLHHFTQSNTFYFVYVDQNFSRSSMLALQKGQNLNNTLRANFSRKSAKVRQLARSNLSNVTIILYLICPGSDLTGSQCFAGQGNTCVCARACLCNCRWALWILNHPIPLFSLSFFSLFHTTKLCCQCSSSMQLHGLQEVWRKYRKKILKWRKSSMHHCFSISPYAKLRFAILSAHCTLHTLYTVLLIPLQRIGQGMCECIMTVFEQLNEIF